MPHRRKLLFCSAHCYVDPTSGAVVSAHDLLRLLQAENWDCRALCGASFDDPKQNLAGALALRELPYSGNITLDGIPVIVDENVTNPKAVSPEAMNAFVASLEQILREDRPDVVLTFGGNAIGRRIIAAVSAQKIPIVFWLRNTSYSSKDLFDKVDCSIVPSQFTADFYARTLGINCTAIEPPFLLERVHCESLERKYLTFVTPLPQKGVFVFARIASELRRLRPDIPIVVVEGRGDRAWLNKTGLDLSHVEILPKTRDPRDFLRITRALLLPSLWHETFGRVAAEAMFNGIPVLGSSRGGIPETFGKAGFVFDVPAHYTPESRRVATVADVAPWTQEIIRLWDDADYYAGAQQRSIDRAKELTPEVLLPKYLAVLDEISGLRRSV